MHDGRKTAHKTESATIIRQIYCDSRKTAGSSIENFKPSKDEPNGAIPTRQRRNKSVCRKRTPRANLTPRIVLPPKGGEHEGCNGNIHQQLCKGEVAERHSSRISPKSTARPTRWPKRIHLVVPSSKVSRAPCYYLSFVLSFKFLCHWKHSLKRASP